MNTTSEESGCDVASSSHIGLGDVRPEVPVDRTRLRLFYLQLCIIGMFGVVLLGLIKVSVFRDPGELNMVNRQASALMRGSIVDRNNLTLARSMACMSPYVDVSYVEDSATYAALFSKAYPKANKAYLSRILQQRIDKGRQGLVRLAHFVTPAEHQAIHDSVLPGITFHRTSCRLYPLGMEAAHVVGSVRKDLPKNESTERLFGERGLEAYFDKELAAGKTIRTTLNSQVQNITYTALARALEQYRAIAGAAIVLDARYGEIIAMASGPSFDPHIRYSPTDQRLLPVASGGSYELGSMFKPLTVAIALTAGSASLGDLFDVTVPLVINGNEIDDFRPIDHAINIPAILMHSSNRGAALVSQTFTPSMHEAFLRTFGFADKLSLELPAGELSLPLFPKQWTYATSIGASYGYGISVSPLHIATAIAMLVNGGHPISPTLRPQTEERKKMLYLRPRVFSSELSMIMRQLLYISAVGSASASQVPGYFVSGKTGTVNRVINGTYSQASSRSSFTATFPGHDPRYIVVIMIDDPRNSAGTGESMTGSRVAAPIAADIIRQIAPLLNIHPRQAGDLEAVNALVPPVAPNTERGRHIFSTLAFGSPKESATDSVQKTDAVLPYLSNEEDNFLLDTDSETQLNTHLKNPDSRSLRAIIQEGVDETSP